MLGNMTNPDSWRHQQSAAPHAPPHDPVTPGLPLGGPTAPLGGEPTTYATPTGSGAGCLLGGAIGVALFSFLIFPILYPLPGLIGIAASLATDHYLPRFAPHLDASDRLP